MASSNHALGRHEIQSGSLLYGGYFYRLKDALGWGRVLLWGIVLFGSFSAFVPMFSAWRWGMGLLEFKAALAWSLVGAFILRLVVFADRRLVDWQRGLVESSQEAQSITSGDPGLYKVYVDLHWREWQKQTLCRSLALLIISGLLSVGFGVGVSIVREVSYSFGQQNVMGWLAWYLAVGLLLQGIKFGIEKLLSLFVEIQERLNPRLEIERVRGLQEVRWGGAVVKCVESQRCQQQGYKGYKNIAETGRDLGGVQDKDADSWKGVVMRRPREKSSF